MASLAWDLKTQVVQGRLAVVNACAENHEYGMVRDEFYVAALTARIEHPTCELQEAKRLVLDGTGALFLLLRGSQLLRCELQWMVMALRQLEVTVMICLPSVKRLAKSQSRQWDDGGREPVCQAVQGAELSTPVDHVLIETSIELSGLMLEISKNILS